MRLYGHIVCWSSFTGPHPAQYRKTKSRAGDGGLGGAGASGGGEEIVVLTRTIPTPDTGQQQAGSNTSSNGSKSNRSLDALLKVL